MNTCGCLKCCESTEEVLIGGAGGAGGAGGGPSLAEWEEGAARSGVGRLHGRADQVSTSPIASNMYSHPDHSGEKELI